MVRDKLILATDDGALAFDAVYPALRAQVVSLIAQELGVRVDYERYRLVDEHQRMGAPRLYSVGNVVAWLNQISREIGQAAKAATALRNDLYTLIRRGLAPDVARSQQKKSRCSKG